LKVYDLWELQAKFCAGALTTIDHSTCALLTVTSSAQTPGKMPLACEWPELSGPNNQFLK
jgi:hypothetical protein